MRSSIFLSKCDESIYSAFFRISIFLLDGSFTYDCFPQRLSLHFDQPRRVVFTIFVMSLWTGRRARLVRLRFYVRGGRWARVCILGVTRFSLCYFNVAHWKFIKKTNASSTSISACSSFVPPFRFLKGAHFAESINSVSRIAFSGIVSVWWFTLILRCGTSTLGIDFCLSFYLPFYLPLLNFSTLPRAGPCQQMLPRFFWRQVYQFILFVLVSLLRRSQSPFNIS